MLLLYFPQEFPKFVGPTISCVVGFVSFPSVLTKQIINFLTASRYNVVRKHAGGCIACGEEAQHSHRINLHLSDKTQDEEPRIMFHHAEKSARFLSEHKQASENTTQVAQYHFIFSETLRGS